MTVVTVTIAMIAIIATITMMLHLPNPVCIMLLEDFT